MKGFILSVAICLVSFIANAQININDLGFLSGKWVSNEKTANGEIIFTNPEANDITGLIRIIENDTVRYYQLISIKLEKNSKQPVLLMKHFNEQIKGWEEKDDVIEHFYISSTLDKSKKQITFISKRDSWTRIIITVIGTELTFRAEWEKDGKQYHGEVTFTKVISRKKTTNR